MNRTTRRTRILVAGLAATAALPAVATANHTPGHQGGGGQANNNVSINATTPITWGRPTTIAGKLTGSGNSGVAVDLQADPHPFADSGFTKVANAATDSNGNYSFVQQPQLNTRYRVVAKASPSVTSSAAAVVV